MTSINDFLHNQEKEIDKKIPFGNPDASRAVSVEDLEKVGSKGFVKMQNKNSGISNNGTEHFRVIVGKKGSGKTLYLRRYYIHLKKEHSIYSEDFDVVIEYLNQKRPQTDHILKFSQLFNGELLTEKWRILWRISIIRTIITHILHNNKLSELRNKLPNDFKKKYKKILSKAERPITVFSQVIEIIDNINDGKSFDKFSNSILWDELDYDLSNIIKEGVPLYFFVDAIDEEYQHAPMYWLRAQKGLFYSLMQFLRDTSIGGKLHILISIRDHVYSSILASEHETRYFDSSYVTILHWNSDSAKYLLLEKIKHLDSNNFVIKGENIIENWLGTKSINNTKRQVIEPISDYIVRHTRSIPRDIVILGNSLSNRILEIKSSSNDFSDFESDLKKIVHHYAKRFAREQVQISANHLTANLMPSQAFDLGIHKMYISAYTGDQEYLNLSTLFTDKIKKIICYIGKDRFSQEDLLIAKEYAIEIFEIGTDLNLFDVLWQNGLLGFDVDDTYSKFFSERTNDFKLPLDQKSYAFHSILIDLYEELQPIGKPVKMKTFDTK